MGQLQPAFTAAEVEFAEQTNRYRRRVVHSVTVIYRLLCMFLWLFVMCIVEWVTTITLCMQHIRSIGQRSAMGQLVIINSLILCVCVCVCDRGFSMISPRKSPRSSCFFLSVTSLGGWLSFKPTLEARLALEVPRPAFRPSFPISHVHRSTIGERASPLSIWVGFGRRSTPFFSPVFGE